MAMVDQIAVEDGDVKGEFADHEQEEVCSF